MTQEMPKVGCRILIADDHELMGRGTRSLLESRDGTEVWEAKDGKEAVEKTRELKPDLVILDVSMPLLDGFSAAREIKTFAPQTRILIVSLDRSDTFVDVARKIGVSGYLTKSEGSQILLEAVDAALKSDGFYAS